MKSNKQKISIEGFIHARKYPWDDKPTYYFFSNDMSEHDYVIIEPFTIELELKAFDFTAATIKQFEAKKQKLQAETFVKVKKIDEDIQNLLCIDDKS